MENNIKKKIEEIIKEHFENEDPIGYVGNGMYHMGGGAYTGKLGFEEFEKELLKLAKAKKNGR
jgi:hypothetical protein